PVPLPIHARLAALVLEHPVRMLLECLTRFGDVRRRDPEAELEPVTRFQLIGKPTQAVRESLVRRPIAGDVAALPAVIELDDLESERLEMLRRDGGVGENEVLRHRHAMGVPTAPKRGLPGAWRM